MQLIMLIMGLIFMGGGLFSDDEKYIIISNIWLVGSIIIGAL